MEALYRRYNRREYVHPDPLEFLYNYSNALDREIVGLIASSLAYGRVAQILKSVSRVLGVMGESPRAFVVGTKEGDIVKSFRGFKHRFHDCRDIAALLIGIKKVINRHGSLEACFLSAFRRAGSDLVAALSGFVGEISEGGGTCMLSDPSKGSACKRLNLYLRWMVRHDDVDPGGWKRIDPSKLIVPLDTHMYKIGRKLGFTKRRQANMKTAVEITKAFSRFSPRDPVRYDFTLTRFGIRGDMKVDSLDKILS